MRQVGLIFRGTFISLSLLSVSFPVWAVPVPLRSLESLSLETEPVAYRVKSAKVLLVDYALLRRDFPTLLKALSNPEIDEWLLQRTALIAKTQYEKGEGAGLNDRIDADTAQAIPVFRPVDYGRGFVFKVGTDGTEDFLMDAKGVGAEDPSSDSGHSDGLAPLPEMVREYAFEKLVHKIFLHSQSGFDTIESYAVIDLGFKASKSGSWPHAGMVLRQAHKRYLPSDQFGWHFYQLEDELAFKIEKVLRRYGVTSTGIGYMATVGKVESRAHDLQGTQEGAVVDFGPFMAAKTFDASLSGMKSDSSDELVILMDSHSRDFVQPDPELCVSIKDWGIELDENTGQQAHRQDEWANRWIGWIHLGIKSKEEFQSFVEGLLTAEEERWKKHDEAHPKKQGLLSYVPCTIL